MLKPAWAVNAEKIMKKMGLQHVDLLEVFDVKTTGAIGHYFNGRREPNVGSIIKLAEVLHLNISELCLGKSEERTALQFSENDAPHLTSALTLLVRTTDISAIDAAGFIKIFETIGAENIIKATNMLSETARTNGDTISTVVEIQDFVRAS